MGDEPGQGWLLAAPLLPTQSTITNPSISSIVMHSSPGPGHHRQSSTKTHLACGAHWEHSGAGAVMSSELFTMAPQTQLAIKMTTVPTRALVYHSRHQPIFFMVNPSPSCTHPTRKGAVTVDRLSKLSKDKVLLSDGPEIQAQAT